MQAFILGMLMIYMQMFGIQAPKVSALKVTHRHVENTDHVV